MDTMELINIIKGRGAVYAFLASAYLKPAGKDFIDQAKEYLPHFKTLKAEISGISEGVDCLEGALGGVVSDLIDINRLNIAHTRMFSMGLNEGSVPATESVYTSDLKIIMQDAWERVTKFYSRFRFGIPVSFKEPEDHIAIELLFMAFLVDKSAECIENNDESELEKYINAQKDLMQTHLLRWVPEFCDAVISKFDGTNSLLVSISKILKGYLAYDADFLESL